MNPLEVHYQNSFAAMKIGCYLSDHLCEDTAIVCIGTDKCIIDSLGPLVGTMLMKNDIHIDVYGTLDKPVHAINLNESIDAIKRKNYRNILAVDACLSSKKAKGILEVRNSPITPGKGIGKMLPDVGDVSIIGIVDSSDKEFYSLVQETRLSLVYQMAEIITEGIIIAIKMNGVSIGQNNNIDSENSVVSL